MKKKILIGIIIAITISVTVFALKENSLYLPPVGPEKLTINYNEISSNNIPTYEASEMTETEKKRLEQMQRESEESEKRNEEGRAIIRRYNPNSDELYKKVMETYRKMEFHSPELTDEEKQLYTMLIDTYENEDLNEREREILKQHIKICYDYIISIPGLQEREDKILGK